MEDVEHLQSGLIEFLSSLRIHKFVVGVDQLCAIQQLHIQLTVDGELPNRDDLKWFLAPIICRSPEEQSLFYELFTDWVTRTPLQTIAHDKNQIQVAESARAETRRPLRRSRQRPPSSWLVRTAFLCAALVVAAALIYVGYRIINRSKPAQPTASTEPLVADGVILDKDARPIANANVVAQEQRPPGLNVNTDHSITVQTAADGTFTLPLSGMSFPIAISAGGREYWGESKIVNTPAEAHGMTFNLTVWRISFWVRLTGVVSAAFVLLAILFWLFRARQLHLRKLRTARKLVVESLRVRGAAEWLPQIFSLRRSAHNLRHPRHTQTADIHLERTIEATVRSGIFSPVYVSKKAAPEYLILINRSSANDQIADFQSRFVGHLEASGVHLDRYYYRNDLRLCWSEATQGRVLTLGELATAHPSHNLLIFDDGSGLFHPTTGKLLHNFEVFDKSITRALLSSDFPLDEYRREKLAELDMLVLPATGEGIAGLGEIVSGGQWQPSGDTAPVPPLLIEMETRWLEEVQPRQEVIDKLLSQLQTYLGADAFDWLAACAIYPTLNWELALYLGYRLLTPEEVVANLFKLLRLPWFRAHNIPDWLRKELIPKLSREQRAKIRNALCYLIASAGDKDHGFLLEISRKPRVGEADFWNNSSSPLKDKVAAWRLRGFVKNLLRSQPPDSELRDHVFLSYILPRKPNPLIFAIPSDLRWVLKRSYPRRNETLILYGIMSCLFAGLVVRTLSAGVVGLFWTLETLVVACLFFYGDFQFLQQVKEKQLGPAIFEADEDVRSFRAALRGFLAFHWSNTAASVPFYASASFEDGLAGLSYLSITAVFGFEIIVAVVRQSLAEILIVSSVGLLFGFAVRQITSDNSTLARSRFAARRARRIPMASELNGRSITVGLAVAWIIATAYPYCVLKLGFGPNLSIVSAFVGFMVLLPLAMVLRSKDTDPRENNIVQTMGTSAGQVAFMATLLAAFDMLNLKGVLNPPIHLGSLAIFCWLCSTSLLGTLLAVPMRRHYIEEENLSYADGLAAGETIRLLHETRESGHSRSPIAVFGGGTVLSGLVMMGSTFYKWVRETWLIPGQEAMNIGFNISLLSIGSGLLVGFRVCLAMAIGTAISWFILPRYLYARGWIAELTYPATLRWVMWPAIGLMVAGGLTSLVLKWKSIVKTFRRLKQIRPDPDDFPLRYVVIGSMLMAIVICLIQYVSMGIPVYLSLVAILLSLPLMQVGLRVLGETNWGPISGLSNLMQMLYAFIAPGSAPLNMAAGGVTATMAVSSEALMQDYKAGQMLESNPRQLTIAQLLAVPVGAAAVAVVYPILRAKFGIGVEGLSSPISVRWGSLAELLTAGLGSLPEYSLVGLLIGVAFGVLLALLAEKWGKYVPSPSAISIGMLISPAVILTFIIGGFLQFVWAKAHPASEKIYRIPLAAGLIAGEALIAVLLAFLAAAGVNF